MKKLILFFALSTILADCYAQVITTYAGTSMETSSANNSGDGASLHLATFNKPTAIVEDNAGSIYIADFNNNVIRKISNTGIVSLFSGAYFTSGWVDGSLSTARFKNPQDIVFYNNALYVADYNNFVIRKIDLATNMVTTVAGNGIVGNSGIDGPATNASIGNPRGVCFDALGNMYIADETYNVIRKVDVNTKNISIFAGNVNTSPQRNSGDGTVATDPTVNLNKPYGIRVVGNYLYITTFNGHNVRRVDLTTNVITLFAGNGVNGVGAAESSIAATSAEIGQPFGLAADVEGNIYISSVRGNNIRKITPDQVHTIAAGASVLSGGYNGDGGNAVSADAKLNYQRGIYINAAGDIYICDAQNNVIRKVVNNTTIANRGVSDKRIFVNSKAKVYFTSSSGNEYIAKLAPMPANSITGEVSAKVWVQTLQPSNYVRRHYEITPANSATSGRITLYFTQEDFDAFNAVNMVKLPTRPDDEQGIANMKIEKFSGVSADGSGSPSSYGTVGKTADIIDQWVTWNPNINRWEVQYDVTGGFSGFFIKTQQSTVPVQLESFSAFVSNGILNVDFVAHNNTNVDRYQIEISNNGIDFIKVGSVNRTQGTLRSENSYIYKYVKDIEVNYGLFYLLLVCFTTMPLFKRRKRVFLLSVVTLLCANVMTISCKKEVDNNEKEEEQVFVRIAQYNQDGTVEYSHVIRAPRK